MFSIQWLYKTTVVTLSYISMSIWSMLQHKNMFIEAKAQNKATQFL